MQTILGANGTIGSLLAKELMNYTNKVRLVSRNPKRVNESDDLFPGDLANPSVVEKAVEGSDVVYLVVGFDYNINVWEKNWPRLMRSTIDACVKYKARLVFFDNVYMYDKSEIPHMTEDSAINPPSRKGQVRRHISQMLTDDVKSGRIMALIARSADFYGPDNKSSMLNELIYKNYLKNRSANWFINTNKKHSFTFTPDAAKATALLGNTNDAYNTVWHLPTDKNTLTAAELAQIFAAEMNVKFRISAMPLWMIKVAGMFSPIIKEMPEMLYQYDRDYFFDSSKFEKRFNFVPTSYREGIKLTVHSS